MQLTTHFRAPAQFSNAAFFAQVGIEKQFPLPARERGVLVLLLTSVTQVPLVKGGLRGILNVT